MPRRSVPTSLSFHLLISHPKLTSANPARARELACLPRHTAGWRRAEADSRRAEEAVQPSRPSIPDGRPLNPPWPSHLHPFAHSDPSAWNTLAQLPSPSNPLPSSSHTHRLYSLKVFSFPTQKASIFQCLYHSLRGLFPSTPCKGRGCS